MQIKIEHLNVIERNCWNAFEKEYPDDMHKHLACHAAFPVALTPDLLYKIWLNFRPVTAPKDPLVSLTTVSDILQSSLCRKIGRYTYEIPNGIRVEMRKALEETEEFGPKRIHQLAQFLNDYIEHNTDKIPSQVFREAQKWEADFYLNPEETARRILNLLQEEITEPIAEKRLDYYLEKIAKSEGLFQEIKENNLIDKPLLIIKQFAQGVREIRAGKENLAIDTFRAIQPFLKTNLINDNAIKTKVPDLVWLFFERHFKLFSNEIKQLDILKRLQEITEKEFTVIPWGGENLQMNTGKSIEKFALNILSNVYIITSPRGVVGLGLKSVALSDDKWEQIIEINNFTDSILILDLSNNDLTRFKIKKGEFQNLRLLNLANNNIADYSIHIDLKTKIKATLTGNPIVKNISRSPFNDAEWKIQTAFESNAKVLSLSGLPNRLPESIRTLTNLKELRIACNGLTEVPLAIRPLKQLERLDLGGNAITDLPDWLSEFTQLKYIRLSGNNLTEFPKLLLNLPAMEEIRLPWNPIKYIPPEIQNLNRLRKLDFYDSQVGDLPVTLGDLKELKELDLRRNPLIPDLAVAVSQGLEAILSYLRSRTGKQIALHEAKLILVGEGGVGQSCLMDALSDAPWQTHISTHGIEIRQVEVIVPDTKTTITLNCWDFGGQQIYRHTHQLFFSAAAVYLVVWKPRAGYQHGLVKEWIQLIKHREPTAKVLVVATHGGPGDRQPDIDRQELWDTFGKETVIDFFHVDSNPESIGRRKGIQELKEAIAKVASQLPEMGREVPQRWKQAKEDFKKTKKVYLTYLEVLSICKNLDMPEEEVSLFVSISHRLGHLIHYAQDTMLRNIVVMKPDWLSNAISYVLDDEETRANNGMVRMSRLAKLWNDPTRPAENRYPADLHPIFLRLMVRFDLAYHVVDPISGEDNGPASLIAQLVAVNRPDSYAAFWINQLLPGDKEQVQLYRITDKNNRSITAEGLFFWLIVRLQKYSLGRYNYRHSVHWQRGLVIDDDYNGRALLEHIGNDVRITVRAAYPEHFLSMLTKEITWVVKNIWEGLRCDVAVYCVHPCGRNQPGTGLFEVEKLIESKKKNRIEYPCPVCNDWQDIDRLLSNATSTNPVNSDELFENKDVINELQNLRHILPNIYSNNSIGRFDMLGSRQKELLSKADASYSGLLQAFIDEAKDGPRLFSLSVVNRSNFNPKSWEKTKFKITLWCEHSKLPLHVLDAVNGKRTQRGVYEVEMSKEWFKKVAPYIKFVTGTLSLVLPVASSGLKLAIDDKTYESIGEQLDFNKNLVDATLDGIEDATDWATDDTTVKQQEGQVTHKHGGKLRELQSLLKEQDPSFGGLVCVLNKRQEFMWVDPAFEGEY